MSSSTTNPTSPSVNSVLLGTAPDVDAIYILIVILAILSIILEIQCIIHFYCYTRASLLLFKARA
ncbi:protein O3 [macacine betaherpesvirus 3]|nr:protein O3 [macacine betaherpesvirus 3]QXV50190.1 protein O3 [macacine betaherpesvirus 3]